MNSFPLWISSGKLGVAHPWTSKSVSIQLPYKNMSLFRCCLIIVWLLIIIRRETRLLYTLTSDGEPDSWLQNFGRAEISDFDILFLNIWSSDTSKSRSFSFGPTNSEKIVNSRKSLHSDVMDSEYIRICPGAVSLRMPADYTYSSSNSEPVLSCGCKNTVTRNNEQNWIPYSDSTANLE